MTEQEFQHEYHTYQTKDAKAAILEADKVCQMGVPVVAVNLDGTWCLMLKRAASALEIIGIAPTMRVHGRSK